MDIATLSYAIAFKIAMAGGHIDHFTADVYGPLRPIEAARMVEQQNRIDKQKRFWQSTLVGEEPIEALKTAAMVLVMNRERWQLQSIKCVLTGADQDPTSHLARWFYRCDSIE